ncbi:MAG: Asd/ArgC dimerization domain-containing protein [Bryobacteraceae bacterium]|nr:Asd/ArgC dimerization domain-containing protein [Bryobacteraceae bacterium]
MQRSVLALVGSESLLGKEIREVADSYVPSARLQLVGADASSIFSEDEGEPVIITGMDEVSLGEAQVAALAGTSESSRAAYAILSKLDRPPAVVDATQTLEDHPRARLRAPMAEPQGYTAEPDAVHVIAHPAAIALAVFFGRLHPRYAVRRAVVQIFEPASEQGQRGLNELQQQTVSLLSFKQLNKEVYDEQVSFNLLARYGSEAPRALEDIEATIERHLATLLSRSSGAPMPSMRLIQAPVFHGYSFSIWVQFEENPGEQAIAEALASAMIETRAKDEEPPTNVGVTGQTGLTVGVIERDRNDAQACWFWAVADNLRIMAENALLVARPLLERAQ